MSRPKHATDSKMDKALRLDAKKLREFGFDAGMNLDELDELLDYPLTTDDILERDADRREGR